MAAPPTPSRPSHLRLAVASGLGVAGMVGLAAFEHQVARRWRAGGHDLADAGLAMPQGIGHHFVPVSDGGLVHVAESGEGPVIVLVHGMALSMATWALQMRSLRATHRVIVLDQRGHGQSTGGTGGFTMDRLGQDLTEVLGLLGVEDAIVVGHSIGGMVALQLAAGPAALAGRVSGLVLVATSAGPVVPPFLAPLPGHLVPVARRVLAAADRHGIALVPRGDTATWLARVSFGRDPSPAHVELIRSMITSMSPLTMAGLLEPLVSFDVRSRLGAVTLPALVVVGTRDVLTPPGAARVLAGSIAGAQIEVLEGCGHMVMLERPGELERAVLQLEAATSQAVR